MSLSIQIVDDFLEDFDQWRAWFDDADYRDVTSAVDSVTYPGICTPLPNELQAEINTRLRSLAGLCVMNHLFARISPAQSRPPHWAHHDGSMGAMSMMLYMNRSEHCCGGTALLEHVHAEPSAETWQRDTNDSTRWRRTSTCPMASNRAFIFPARMWHAALPAAGFGSTTSDSRLVITAFFS